MNRSRHGEGNNLFGGRQKLYKIPAGSAFKSSLSAEVAQPESAGMNGRVLYENDVSLSMFQKHRQKERQEKKDHSRRDSLDDAEDQSIHSPATSFSKDRGTTSSTASGPRRNSTAATSIDSQSPVLNHNNGSTSSLGSPKVAIQPKPEGDPSHTIHRKLYGQAWQQSSSLHCVAKDAFDNLNRPGAASNDTKITIPSPIKVISNLNEGPSRTIPSHPSSNFRSASPPPSVSPSGRTNLDSKLAGAKSFKVARNPAHGHTLPLSPPVSDGEDAATLVNSLQPEDRGKATAMGIFHKPSRDYDEQKFSQRQLQMHRGRNSPVPKRASPTPAANLTPPDEAVAGIKTNDDSKEVSNISKNARARAASLIRRQNEELAALEAQLMASTGRPKTRPPASQDVVAFQTLLDIDDEPPSKVAEMTPPKPSNKIPKDTHPAFRPLVEEPKFPSSNDPSTIAQPVEEPRLSSFVSDGPGRKTVGNDDSDPPSEGFGLSGLIRTHLRSDSDNSSIYPPVSPRMSPRMTPTFANDSPKVEAPVPDTNGSEKEKQSKLTDAQFKMAQNAKQFLANAALLRTRSQRFEDPGQSRQPSESYPTWHDELQSRHQRGGSTETQQEREAFHNELAERRRKVQETLKNAVESNSRSASLVLAAEPGPTKHGIGLSARLRPRPSQHKLNNNPSFPPDLPNHSTKTKKLLGLGGGGSSPNIASPEWAQGELWKEEEERMLEDFGRRPKPKHTFGPSPTRPFPRAPPEPSLSRSTHSEDSERSQQRSVTLASTSISARDRSASEVSARSRSRNGQYREDLDKPKAEGNRSRGRVYGLPNSSNTSTAAGPTNEVGEQPERPASPTSGRYPSNSRTNTPGYLESKPLNPLQTSGMSSASHSSRPSPRTPYSANSTPPIFEASSTNSPPAPIAFNQPVDGRITPSLRGRKRSITKNMISDPTFVSTTYTVTTVDLPPGASLRNGSPENHPKDSPSPAIPFMNPARRRGRVGTSTSTTHTLFSTLTGRANDSKSDLAGPLSARPSLPEERSNFSDEGEDKKPAPFRPRQKLRKVSSEGGGMNAKARYQALMAAPSPALPTFPVKRGPSPPMQRVEGGMF